MSGRKKSGRQRAASKVDDISIVMKRFQAAEQALRSTGRSIGTKGDEDHINALLNVARELDKIKKHIQQQSKHYANLTANLNAIKRSRTNRNPTKTPSQNGIARDVSQWELTKELMEVRADLDVQREAINNYIVSIKKIRRSSGRARQIENAKLKRNSLSNHGVRIKSSAFSGDEKEPFTIPNFLRRDHVQPGHNPQDQRASNETFLLSKLSNRISLTFSEFLGGIKTTANYLRKKFVCVNSPAQVHTRPTTADIFRLQNKPLILGFSRFRGNSCDDKKLFRGLRFTKLSEVRAFAPSIVAGAAFLTIAVGGIELRKSYVHYDAPSHAIKSATTIHNDNAFTDNLPKKLLNRIETEQVGSEVGMRSIGSQNPSITEHQVSVDGTPAVRVSLLQPGKKTDRSAAVQSEKKFLDTAASFCKRGASHFCQYHNRSAKVTQAIWREVAHVTKHKSKLRKPLVSADHATGSENAFVGLVSGIVKVLSGEGQKPRTSRASVHGITL